MGEETTTPGGERQRNPRKRPAEDGNVFKPTEKKSRATTSRSTFHSVRKRPPEESGTDRVERVPSFQARCYGATAGLIIGGTIGSLLFAFLGLFIFFPGDFMWCFAIILAILGWHPGPYWIDKAIKADWWP